MNWHRYGTNWRHCHPVCVKQTMTGAVVLTEHYYIVRCFILAVLSTVLSSRWNLAETNTSRNTRLMKNKNSVKLQSCSKDSQQAWIYSCGQHRTSIVCLFYLTRSSHKKVKVAHTRLSSVGFWRWSRFLAVSLQVTWVINPTVGCHYFPPGLQLPPQPLRGLLPILLLGEQRHDGCEQFA